MLKVLRHEHEQYGAHNEGVEIAARYLESLVYKELDDEADPRLRALASQVTAQRAIIDAWRAWLDQEREGEFIDPMKHGRAFDDYMHRRLTLLEAAKQLTLVGADPPAR